MSTKERIIDEALTLFSTKGYKGTSVKNIADAVGIKDSSLYKHYSSKKEILDTIMDTIRIHIDEMSKRLGIINIDSGEDSIAFYESLNLEGLISLSRQIFLFYLKDDLLSKFWRMGTMEQYHNEEIYKLYRKFFLEDSITCQTEIFRELSNNKVLINEDPEIMAFSFYSPIFFLLSKYSGTEGKENEALEILDKQVKQFYRVYSNKN